jgi:hypothetical protein
LCIKTYSFYYSAFYPLASHDPPIRHAFANFFGGHRWPCADEQLLFTSRQIGTTFFDDATNGAVQCALGPRGCSQPLALLLMVAGEDHQCALTHAFPQFANLFSAFLEEFVCVLAKILSACFLARIFCFFGALLQFRLFFLQIK